MHVTHLVGAHPWPKTSLLYKSYHLHFGDWSPQRGPFLWSEYLLLSGEFCGCKDNPIILPSRWALHLAQPNHQAFAVSIGLKEASDLENLKVWHKFDFPSGVYQRCQVQSAGLFEGYAANKSQNILNHKHFHCMGWSKKLYLWFVFGKHWTVCAMRALSAASPSNSPINTLKKCIQAD